MVLSAVVCVTELIAAFITIHGLCTFLAMNRDELSHAYDHFPGMSSSRCVKNRKN